MAVPVSAVTRISATRYLTTPTAPLLSSDAVLRNVAFVSVLFALALLFLNIALYIAVVSVGILVPAWRTFKTLERPLSVLKKSNLFNKTI